MIRLTLTAFELAGCLGAAWLTTKYGIMIGGYTAFAIVIFAYAEASLGLGRK